MGPQVRSATAQDIPALAALIPESVRALSAGFYSADQIEAAIVHVFGLDMQLISDGTYLVAELDGDVAGCGGWSRRKTLYGGNQTKGAGPDPLLDPAHDPARIRAFYVNPRWARRGVGAALMQACEAAARAAGFRSMALMATLPGQKLYTAAGFTAGAPTVIQLPGGLTLPVVPMTKHIGA